MASTVCASPLIVPSSAASSLGNSILVPQFGQYLPLSSDCCVTNVLQEGQRITMVPRTGAYCSSASCRYDAGKAKPRLSPPLMIKVLTPTTSPAAFTSGPPELPGLMAASI